jgi:N6-L-threonylcarbamoyladenine synthase
LARLGEDAVKAVILAGGVAANSRVRERFRLFAQRASLPLLLPSPSLCTDNAAMIAYAGSLLLRAGFSHGLDFPAIPRGQKVPDDYRRNFG